MTSLVVFGLALVPLLMRSGAQAAGRDTAAGEAAVQAQRAPWQTCDTLQPQVLRGGFNDPSLALTDADMIAGSSGQRLCVFWDRLWDVYAVYPINIRTLDEFRLVKDEMTPLLEGAGVDLCRIAYWQPPARTTNFNYFHEVGRACRPEFIAHSGGAESRLDEVRAALERARTATDRVFGWSPSWPVRIHVYDNQAAYVEGVRVDAGAASAEVRAKTTAGMAITQSDRITAILVNIAGFTTADDLTALMAHEYHHITQSGLLGSTSVLPTFVTEGGAEYFGSLVVGPDQPHLADRFQAAVDKERSGRAIALSRLIRAGATADTYERGYAAMRFLAERWGADRFAQLYMENIDGTPDQYLLQLSRLTEMTLDEFDRELNAWLRGFPSKVVPPTPVPSRTPRPAPTPRP
jgi:hypothetical protein